MFLRISCELIRPRERRPRRSKRNGSRRSLTKHSGTKFSQRLSLPVAAIVPPLSLPPSSGSTHFPYDVLSSRSNTQICELRICGVFNCERRNDHRGLPLPHVVASGFPPLSSEIRHRIEADWMIMEAVNPGISRPGILQTVGQAVAFLYGFAIIG